MMPSWHRQVNWGNRGFPWLNCAVLCVKDDWKGQLWGLCYCLSKLRSLLSFFPSGMTSHSKIAQFHWECIGRLREATRSYRGRNGRRLLRSASLRWIRSGYLQIPPGYCFDVLLTVHLSIFILVINQLDAQNVFYSKFISRLYMFRAPCAHRQEVKIVLYSLW